MTTTIGHRQRILDLPEAGKPEGTCPECGPHGNRGWVDLSVFRRLLVPCLACSARANAEGQIDADALLAQVENEIRAEGCEPLPGWTTEVNPPDGDEEHPWHRRVTVVVPYRHAHKDALADMQAQVDASRAAVAASRTAVTVAQQALANRMRTILGVP